MPGLEGFFEKTGDWFSLALDALDDLKREIENE